MQRIFPIERYFIQGYEPNKENKDAKTRVKLKNGHTYEIQAKVQDKNVAVEVYEVGKFYSKRVTKINYVFEKERPEKEYPIAIETTGNIEIILEDVEVWKLKEITNNSEASQ